MKYPLAIMGLAFLAGCASAPTDPAYATPTCHSYSECEARWNAAEIWINRHAGRTVESRTDTLMQTSMSQNPANVLAVIVEKAPMGNGGWRIEAKMYCARQVGCDPNPWEATQDFNHFVNRAWVVPDKDVREQSSGN